MRTHLNCDQVLSRELLSRHQILPKLGLQVQLQIREQNTSMGVILGGAVASPPLHRMHISIMKTLLQLSLNADT